MTGSKRTTKACPHATLRARILREDDRAARVLASAQADEVERELPDARDGADWTISTACLRELLRRAEKRGKAAAI